MKEEYIIAILATRTALNLLKYEYEDILNIKGKIINYINKAIEKDYVKLIQFDEIEFVIKLLITDEDKIYEYKKQLWSKEMVINKKENLELFNKCKQN
jgi:hypothetical protein